MAFNSGVVVFFRALDRNDSLTRSVHQNGRDVEIRTSVSHAEDYVVRDENDDIIGIYPRDWVACILPLVTEGPAAHAANQPPRRDSASPPEEGDTQGLPGRAKRFNS